MKCLFVHVPRCGGMSFYYFLEEVFSEKSSVRFGDSVSVSRFLAGDDSFESYGCLSGHLPFRYFADRKCEFGRFTIAFVRDPIEREQSSYGNILKHGYGDHEGVVSDNPSQYWEDFPRMSELHNMQCHYFSEQRDFDGAKQNILQSRICVFAVEDMPVVAEIIKSFAKVPYTPRKTNSSDRDTIQLVASQLEQIRQVCAEDTKLFAWVRENRQFFQEMLKAEIWRSYLVKGQ